MKIYTKTHHVLLLLALSVTTAFSQPEGQEGKTPPKKEKPGVVKVEDKNDREQQQERQKQEEQKRREQERNKKPQ